MVQKCRLLVKVDNVNVGGGRSKKPKILSTQLKNAPLGICWFRFPAACSHLATIRVRKIIDKIRKNE